MQSNLTEIVVVLDRSGSMASVAADTVGGFNTFCEDQKKIEGDCNLTLVQFDTEYDFVYRGVPLAEVKSLDFHPRGGTALLDALGRAINETDQRLGALKCGECGGESMQPKTVMFVIITDGQENSSKEFTRDKIFDMIKAHDNWQFAFLGANQDAIAEAGALGIRAAASMNYAANAEGTRSAFASTSSNLRETRTSGKLFEYGDDDREKQEDAGA